MADSNAFTVLAPLLDADGYCVPLLTREYAGPEYWGYVCVRELDALSDGVELSRLPSGTVMHIPRLTLREVVVVGVAAFSLTAWPHGPVFFARSVADAAIAAGLTGVTWRDAWSNKPGHTIPERRLFSW